MISGLELQNFHIIPDLKEFSVKGLSRFIFWLVQAFANYFYTLILQDKTLLPGVVSFCLIHLGYRLEKKNQNLELNPSALGWMPKLSKLVLLSSLIIQSVFSLAPPNKQSLIPHITPENSRFNQGTEKTVVWEQNDIWAFLNFSQWWHWLSLWPWRSHFHLSALGFKSI